MNGGDAEGFLAHAAVGVQHGQRLVNGLEQVVVDADGDVVRVQCRFPGGLIAVGLGHENVALYITRVGGGEGGAISAVGLHHALIGGLAHRAVRAFQHRAITGMGQLDHLAVLTLDLAKAHVHVGEHIVHIARSAKDFLTAGQQGLHFGGQNMGTHPLQILQHHVEIRKIRVGDVAFQGSLGQLQQLGGQKGHGGAVLGVQGLGAGHHALIEGISVIHVQVTAGIGIQAAQVLVGLRIGFQQRKHSILAVLQRSGIGGQFLGLFLNPLEILFPILLRGINVAGLPLRLRGNVLAQQNFAHDVILLAALRRKLYKSIVDQRKGKNQGEKAKTGNYSR